MNILLLNKLPNFIIKPCINSFNYYKSFNTIGASMYMYNSLDNPVRLFDNIMIFNMLNKLEMFNNSTNNITYLYYHVTNISYYHIFISLNNKKYFILINKFAIYNNIILILY